MPQDCGLLGTWVSRGVARDFGLLGELLGTGSCPGVSTCGSVVVYSVFAPPLIVSGWYIITLCVSPRLYGGYEALKGGKTSEAMVDFTGGVVESFTIEKEGDSLFPKILRHVKCSSLMSCSIK